MAQTGYPWGSYCWGTYCWGAGTWGSATTSVTPSSLMVWSRQTATDLSRQFVTIGPLPSTEDVDFVLTVDEAHPVYLSDEAQPFLLIQEVMEEP